MPLVLDDARSDTVVRFLRMQHGGATLNQIRSHFTPPIPARTVQRLLTSLVDIGALTSIGAKRNRRYQLRTKTGPLGNVVWIDPESEVGVRIEEVAAVQRPAEIEAAPKRPRPAAGRPRPASPAAPTTTPASPAPAPATAAAATASDPAVPTQSVPPAADLPLPVTKSIPAVRVGPILGRILPDFLRRQITPDRVAPELALPAVALFVLKPGESVDDLVSLVVAALDGMTAATAARYACDAAQFAAWREIQWPADSVLSPPPPSPPLPPLDLPPSVTPGRLPVLLREVAYVIKQRMKPEALRGYLETQKGWLRGAETVDDWVTVLTAELDRVRLDDAVGQYRVRPEQFRLWRKTTWPQR